MKDSKKHTPKKVEGKKERKKERKRKDLGNPADPIIHIPIQKHLPPSLTAHQTRYFFEFSFFALPLDLHHLLCDFIPEQPARVPPSPEHQLRVRLLRLHDRLLHLQVYRRLNRTHEPRPHVYPLRPET